MHSVFKEASITQNTKASCHHHSIFSQQFHWFVTSMYSVSSNNTRNIESHTPTYVYARQCTTSLRSNEFEDLLRQDVKCGQSINLLFRFYDAIRDPDDHEHFVDNHTRKSISRAPSYVSQQYLLLAYPPSNP